MKKLIFACSLALTSCFIAAMIEEGKLALADTKTGGLTSLGIIDSTGATSTAPVKSGTSLPATCGVGQLYFKTDATAATVLYACTSPNTWTQQTGAAAAASTLVRTCEIIIGDPGAGSAALANDNDTPDICTNDTGATLTITAVHCYSDAGSPTVTPIITGGSGTSILSGALTCSQTAGGAAGTLNGTPTQTNGQSIDANITSAGGTAKYAVIRITRTL